MRALAPPSTEGFKLEDHHFAVVQSACRSACSSGKGFDLTRLAAHRLIYYLLDSFDFESSLVVWMARSSS